MTNRHFHAALGLLAILALTTLSILGNLTPGRAVAATPQQVVRVRLDGNAMSFPDQQPVIVTGRTLVPVRFVSEALGATVEWVDSTRTVIIRQGANAIDLPVGSRTIRVNQVSRNIDVPAQLIGGRTMVPLRFISENLGADVEWLQAEMTVSVFSPIDPLRAVHFDPAVHINPDGTLVFDSTIEFAKRVLDNLTFTRRADGRVFVRYNHVPTPPEVRVGLFSLRIEATGGQVALFLSNENNVPQELFEVSASWEREVVGIQRAEDVARVQVIVRDMPKGGKVFYDFTRREVDDGEFRNMAWYRGADAFLMVGYRINRAFRWR